MYELERHTLFYTDEGARELYKQHVQKIVQRKNTITGVAYKDDPIILGWALLNELRCESWRVCLSTRITNGLTTTPTDHMSGMKDDWGGSCRIVLAMLKVIHHKPSSACRT